MHEDNKNASQTTIKRGTFDGGCYPSSLFRMLHKKSRPRLEAASLGLRE